jgi:hypothetical protein
MDFGIALALRRVCNGNVCVPFPWQLDSAYPSRTVDEDACRPARDAVLVGFGARTNHAALDMSSFRADLRERRCFLSWSGLSCGVC